MDVTQIVCNGTAVICTYSGRTYTKDVEGFALCGLYYKNGWKGPIVVSPNEAVAHYNWGGGVVPATGYVTINGTNWYYTSSAAWYSGNWSPSGGSYTYYFGSFSSEAAAATAVANLFYDNAFTLSCTLDNTSHGTIVISGDAFTGLSPYYSSGEVSILMYTARGWSPAGWYKNGSLQSNANPYVFNLTTSTALIGHTQAAGSCILL